MAVSESTGSKDYVQQTGSRKAAYANSIIRVFTLPRPANADAAETGTFLAEFTVNAGAFTPGEADNGLNFGTSSGGILAKASGEVWATIADASGNAYWWRLYSNEVTEGVSTTAKRIDGLCSTAEGSDFQFSTLAMTAGGGATISAFNLIQP